MSRAAWFWLGWAAGILTIALLLVAAPAVAGRGESAPAPSYPLAPLPPASRPPQGPFPAAPAGTGAPVPGSPTPDSSASRRVPGPSQRTAIPSAAPTTRPSPPGTPRAARAPRVVASGTASFVDPSYGASYLALPMSLGGRGVLVEICSVERCVTRRSTDAGPVASLHRVADLSYRDAAYLCGCDPYIPGLITVEVRAL